MLIHSTALFIPTHLTCMAGLLNPCWLGEKVQAAQKGLKPRTFFLDNGAVHCTIHIMQKKSIQGQNRTFSGLQ